jgi:ribosome-binding factor A
MASPRVQKVADQIKVIVAEMLERRIKDPRLGFITVTDVKLTGDSREATVFYTVLGSESDVAGTQIALASATGLIRSQVGKQLGMKFTPTVEFVLDAIPETAKQIDDLLARARSVDARVAEQAVGASYAGEADPYKRDEPDEDEPDEASAVELTAADASADGVERPAR